MASKNYLFSFDDLTKKDRAVKAMSKEFAKQGANIIDTDIPATVKRKSGISYRVVNLSFADSQIVSFFVKKTGDIFEVRLNNRVLPIKEQDNQIKAIKEIVDAMDKGRSAFQKKLARAKVEVPKSATVSSTTTAKKQAEKIDSLKAAVAETKGRIEEVKTKSQTLRDEIEAMSAQLAS